MDVAADNRTIPVRVSADTPELNSLALQAFGSHGRYHVVASGYIYDIRFSLAGPAQVRVDVTKGAGEPVASEIVSGTGERKALLRAADFAVEKTNGLGLRGYFASRLVFIGRATGHQEVYKGDLFFGEVRQITHDRAIAMMPAVVARRRPRSSTRAASTGLPDIYRHRPGDVPAQHLRELTRGRTSAPASAPTAGRWRWS